jgi:2-polyprenyl-3-methyl-5-hydroxy-6-metoxy-1,4-benzoquinol methylase
MHDVPQCGCCGSDRDTSAGFAQGLELRRCSDCGTVRFSKVVDHEHIYNDGYHTGESEFGWDFDSERDYQLALSHEILEWVEGYLPKGRMIDVGGGNGYFAAIAADRGWNATLLEPVEAACAFARDNYGIEAIAAGAEVLAGLGTKYELVTLIHALEHFTNPREILEQVRTAIAPGGALYVEVPNFASAAHRLQGDGWYGLQVGQHVHHFTPATLRALMVRAGYEIIEQQTKVPGWDGLIPSAYAHWIGLERALHRGVDLKRKLVGRSRAHTVSATGSDVGAHGVDATDAPAPMNQMGRVGRVVRTGFGFIAKLEEQVGLGTNNRLLARPRQ